MNEKSMEFFKLANFIAGPALIILGILGFVPAVMPNGMVFGLFMVDGFHNCVHITTGFLLLIAGLKPNKITIFITFLIGFAFLALSIFGFFFPASAGSFNTPDNLLHLAISLFALFQGWIITKVSE